MKLVELFEPGSLIISIPLDEFIDHTNIRNFEHIDKKFEETKRQLQSMQEIISKIVENPRSEMSESEDYNDEIEISRSNNNKNSEDSEMECKLFIL